MDIKRKVRSLLARKPNEEVEALKAALKANEAFIVALARLTFVKPSNLIREAKNTKANAEYLLEMTKALKEAK